MRKLIPFIYSLRVVNIVVLVVASLVAIGSLPAYDIFPFKPKSIFSHPLFVFLLFYLALGACLYLYKKSALFYSQKTNMKPGILSSVLADRFNFSIAREEGRLTVETMKNQWGKWGGPLLHFGMLLVLLGGFVTWRFATIRDIEINEGEMLALSDHVKIKLEKFHIDFDAKTLKPAAYTSRLLIQKDKDVFHKELKVNHPVQIRSWHLFQMRYHYVITGIKINLFRSGAFVENVELKPGERKPLQKLPLWIEITEVIPDFAIDRQKKVVSRSIYFHNPAVRVALYSEPKAAQPLSQSWAFQGLIMPHEQHKHDEWTASLNHIHTRYTSGIKVSNDPGAPIVYIGFLGLVLGAFISSFIRSYVFTIPFDENNKLNILNMRRQQVELLEVQT